MSALPVEQRNGTQPGTTILRPEGPMVIAVLPEFNAAAKAVTDHLLVLDLGGVPHMDSAGLGAILTLHSARAKDGKLLAVAAPTQKVQMLIKLTKVDTVLKVFPSVEAAEHA